MYMNRNLRKTEIISYIKTFLLTILAVWFLMNFVIINAVVPTGSMESTIMPGDRLFGLRITNSYERGDIVVFKDPETPNRYLIKRVIGLPGETVEIKKDDMFTASVYINGEKLTENYLKEPMLFSEELKLELPDDGYFMMGDNRNNSYDARFWNRKIIYEDEIVGKAFLKYWPISELDFLYRK